jgi:N6-L-threonylcarbamoyladenine synthase
MIVVGIESSCDETAAALVADGEKIVSSVVASQVEAHHPYGGVVPEIASRKHIEGIVPVVAEAVRKSGLDQTDIDAIAVTQGPGLVGALLVGFCFAKAWAYALDIPWVGVDHLQGHINSVFLSTESPRFPFIALLVSGGHTNVYHVTSHTKAELLGQTRDDAAGEAFDKVAKMLGLGYPGGRVIDELSKKGDSGKVKFSRPFLDKNGFDFSFSGIKSAVHRYIQSSGEPGETETADIVAGFQEAVVDVLSFKAVRAAKKMRCSGIALVGGVAANSRLRDRLREDAGKEGIQVFIPAIDLCGDNAAMIAAAGYHYLLKGRQSRLNDDVYSRMPVRV